MGGWTWTIRTGRTRRWQHGRLASSADAATWENAARKFGERRGVTNFGEPAGKAADSIVAGDGGCVRKLDGGEVGEGALV